MQRRYAPGPAWPAPVHGTGRHPVPCPRTACRQWQQAGVRGHPPEPARVLECRTRNQPPAQSATVRRYVSSIRIPLKAATRMRSESSASALPVRSAATSISVNGHFGASVARRLTLLNDWPCQGLTVTPARLRIHRQYEDAAVILRLPVAHCTPLQTSSSVTKRPATTGVNASTVTKPWPLAHSAKYAESERYCAAVRGASGPLVPPSRNQAST